MPSSTTAKDLKFKAIEFVHPMGGGGGVGGGGGEGGGGGGECGGGEGGRGCGNGGGSEGEGGGGDSISWPRQPAQSYET